jgi:heme-degrading monooxygenase HmoA
MTIYQDQKDAGRAAATCRVNRFAVPSAARAEFLAILARTNEVIRRQPGFRRALLLEQAAGPDLIHLVAVIELADAAAAEQIAAAVAADDRAAGLDRKAMAARLGITAELGSYRPIDMLTAEVGFPQ